MKNFFFSVWFLVIFCIVGLVGSGFATYYTPMPYNAITACILGNCMGLFIAWWFSKYLNNKNNK